MQIGIIGLPNVGKSTLFNALTKSNALIANYPFTTIEPNVGVVIVPDQRLQKIAEIVKSSKVTNTAIKFVDIAGLVKGASSGEGLGNKFLSHIKEVDAVINLIRGFEDSNVTHVFNTIDAFRDFEVIRTELALADLQMLQNRIESVQKMSKSGQQQYINEKKFIESLILKINNGQQADESIFSEEEAGFYKNYKLLSAKPVLYVLNVDENMISKNNVLVSGMDNIEKISGKNKILKICVKLEYEMLDLNKDEIESYLKEYGIKEQGLNVLIKEAYDLLSLITFYTFNENELRAWTVKKDTRAQNAAGCIHSDMEKGFIRVEVIKSEDLIRESSTAVLRDKGLIYTEGKEYIVKDGDILYFKFNV